MGTMYLAATSTKPSSGSYLPFLIILVLFGGFYFLILRPQRNRQKATLQRQGQAEVGQRIRTTAGMYGTIVSGDDKDIVLEVAPGVHISMLRRSIMEILPEPTPDGEITDAAAEPADETPGDADSDADHESSEEFGDQPVAEDKPASI